MLENTASLVVRPFQYIGSNSIIHYLGFIVVNGFIFQYYFAEKLKSDFRSICFLPHPANPEVFPSEKNRSRKACKFREDVYKRVVNLCGENNMH